MYDDFMKFDSIILDIDGTIWNTTPIVAEAWNKAIQENFPQVPRVTPEILQGQFGKTMTVIGDNLFVGLDDNQKKILLDACCKYEHDAIANNTKNITYEGVVQTIAALSKKVPLFIVSNCQAGYIQLVCKKNKIESYITDSVCFGDNDFTKDKNIALIVERNHLKNPAYVGDTLGDFEACKLAEVSFIWATYGFGKITDSVDGKVFAGKIDTFSELSDFVE